MEETPRMKNTSLLGALMTHVLASEKTATSLTVTLNLFADKVTVPPEVTDSGFNFTPVGFIGFLLSKEVFTVDQSDDAVRLLNVTFENNFVDYYWNFGIWEILKFEINDRKGDTDLLHIWFSKETDTGPIIHSVTIKSHEFSAAFFQEIFVGNKLYLTFLKIRQR